MSERDDCDCGRDCRAVETERRETAKKERDMDCRMENQGDDCNDTHRERHRTKHETDGDEDTTMKKSFKNSTHTMMAM